MTTSAQSPSRLALVSAFICLNILSIVTWIAPKTDQRTRVLSLLDPYIQMSGLYQDFVTFSPDVNLATARLFASVRLANGSEVEWDFPETSKMDIIRKMYKERYRDLSTALLDKKNRFLLPFVAKYIARNVYERTGKASVPESVIINVQWTELPPPDNGARPNSGITEMLRYKVVPGDFK